MADQELRSLRVSMQMDAGGYKAGADAKVAADKAMVASGREVAQSVVANDSKISQSGDAIERLSRRYIDGYGNQQKFASGLTTLNRQLETGKATVEQAAAVLVGMNQKLGLTGDVTALVAKGQTSLAEAMSMANTTIAAQQGTLSRAVGEWQIYIAQLKEAQAVQTGAQIASANQNRFNSVLGVQTQPSSSARESASVFAAGLQDIDNLAQLKAQQIGQNFGDDLNRSLVAGSSKSARDAATAFSTELDRIDALAQLKATQIGANFQNDLNASFGIGAGGGSARASASVFEEAGREADQMAAKVALLRAEINPLAAAQDRLNAELAEYSALAAKGAISAEELSAAQALARNRAANQNNQGGLNRFGAMNATSQFQDIAVTAAMGQSPMTIALQQGTQLGMAMQMQMGDQGAKGVVKGLGTAFMGLLTPINLVAIGLTGAAALAIQYFTSGAEKSKLLDQSLQNNVKSIKALTDAYHMAGVSAEDLQRKSIAASEADERRSEKELEAQIRLEQKRFTANTKPTDLMTFGMLGDNSVNVAPEFAAFTDPILKLRKEIEAQAKGEGKANFDAFFQQLDQIANTGPGAFTGFVDELVRSTGIKVESYSDIRDRLYEMGGAARQAARQLELVLEVQRKIDQENTRQGLQDQRGLGRYVGTRNIQEGRENEQFAASQQMQRARTNAERLAAVEREARAKFPAQADEGGGRDARVERARQEELVRQQMELKDAQDQRRRSLDQTLASAKLDVDLVGQTTAAVEGLRLAAQLEAEVREQAAIKGVKADEGEIARIKAKAAEYGRLKAIEDARTTIKGQVIDLETQRAELGLIGQNTLAHDRAIASLKAEQDIRKLGIPLYGQEANEIRKNTAELAALAEASAKAKIQQDLLFDIRQAGRSQQDQSVASQLRNAGLPEDLDSDIAKVIKMKDQIASMKDTWNEVFQTARDGIDGVVDALFDGGDIGDALKKMGRDFARQMFDLAATNPLKNWLTGSNLNTIADMGIFGSGASSGKGGGFGGVLGNLLGAQKAVASMQVQAASVFINGAPIGGGIPGIPGLPGAANDNSGGGIFSSVEKFLFGGQGGTSPLTGDIAKFAAGIKAVESGGNYSALGPMLKNGDQALGAYQVMKSNLPSWSQEALGKTLSPDQFLSDPAAQDKIFEKIFGKSLSKYGNGNDAISSWFTGGPLSTGAGKSDILGTTGSKYVDMVNAQMQKLGETTSSLTSATGTAAVGLNGLGGGLGKLGSALNQFPAAPGGGGGGGPLGWLGNLFNSFGPGVTPAGMSQISPMATADIMSGSWGLFANGAAFRSGSVIPFANGDTFSTPTRFPMSGGRTGVLGEAGEEAIMPLRRGADGRLGVAARTPANTNGGGITAAHIEEIVNSIAKKLSFTAKNINVYDPSVVGDYTRTDDGEQAVVNVMRRTGSGRASLG